MGSLSSSRSWILRPSPTAFSPRPCWRDCRRHYRHEYYDNLLRRNNIIPSSSCHRPNQYQLNACRFGRYHSTSSIDNRTNNARHENENKSRIHDNIIIEGTIPSHGVGMQLGQYATLHRSFRQEDVNTFGTLIGDFNPVHYPARENNDDETSSYSQQQHHSSTAIHRRRSDDDKPIVHGMLISSLFSTIFATLVPGCIYRSQSLKFQSPVSVEEQICGRVVVKKLRRINRGRGGRGGVLCMCDTIVTKTANVQGGNVPENNESDDGILCISGEAQVWLPGATIAE